MPKFEKLSKLSKYGAAISFLAMEIFAMIAFSFGNNYILYGALSLALVILLILFNIREIKVDGVSSIALFFLPLFLFAIVTAFGIYSRSHMNRGDYNIGELIFIPLGLLPMSFVGYMLSVDKTFKIKHFLVVIYSALGILVLINLIVNFVNFGAFYTVIYKGYHMYYGGVMSDATIDKMAYALEGFKFIEVEMSHYVLYPALLLTSSIALFFISPLKQKKLFVFYAVATLVAVLSLVFVPSILGAFSIGMIAVIDLVIFIMKKFAKTRKPFSIAFKVIIIVGLVGFAILVLNQQMMLPFHKITESNAFLNKLFNTNGIVSKYNPLILNVFSSERFLGYAVGSVTLLDEVHMTGSFFFDFFMTSGVIGVIAFIFAVIIGLRGFDRYFRMENDDFYAKGALVSFVVFYLIYAGTFNSTEYGIYYNIFKPIYMTGPFMIMIFIFSYVLAKAPKVEAPKKEEVEVKANEEI